MSATVANVEQAKAWDGPEGDDWANEWERYDAATADHHARLFEVLDLSVDDRVLDIGCGNGLTTRDAARAATAGRAHGIDLSTRMLERARELSEREGLSNTTFEKGDAQVHPFDAEAFDVAMSKFTAMFFSDQTAAFANIGRALRPGGRLVVMSWSGPEHNEWLAATSAALAAGRELQGPPIGAPGPFGMADQDQVLARLTDAGYADIEIEEHIAPFWFGADSDDAYAFFQRTGVFRGFTQGLDVDQLHQVHTDLRATMDAHDTGDGVYFESAGVLVAARKA